MREIKWSDIKIGDTFVDGSTVLDIKPWQLENAYEIFGEEGSLIASKNHLLKSVVRKNGHIINNNLFRSTVIRNQIGIEEDYWLCLEDIYAYWQLTKIQQDESYTVHVLDLDGNDLPILNIVKVEPKKVRCITTDSGFYAVNGFINHNTGGKNMDEVAKRAAIIETYDGWGSSPVVQAIAGAETTEEARQKCFELLKQEYIDNGIEIDNYNIKIAAKKLTSYKRDPKTGTRYVKDGEKCSVISMGAIGNMDNPFKSAELQSGYKTLTNIGEFEMKPDAANEIIF